jgi:hypothetical protein
MRRPMTKRFVAFLLAVPLLASAQAPSRPVDPPVGCVLFSKYFQAVRAIASSRSVMAPVRRS